MNGSHVRFLLLVALCSAAVLAVRAPAPAATEFCPARAQLELAGVTAPAGGLVPSSSTYSLVLSALSARTVSGTVVMRTDSGWYTLPFNDVGLTAYPQKWKDSFNTFTAPSFLSPVMYLKFPQPVVMRAWFVSDASTSGETVFGWDAKGKVTCAGGRDISIIAVGSGAYSANPTRGDLHWENPVPASTAAPPADAVLLTPSLTSAPGSLDCALPFADATVTKPIAPRFPLASRGESGETFVQVAIGADGKVQDAWVWGPSGDGLLDAAALEAAQDSKYAPARAFCQNVPGIYIFRTEFRSR